MGASSQTFSVSFLGTQDEDSAAYHHWSHCKDDKSWFNFARKRFGVKTDKLSRVELKLPRVVDMCRDDILEIGLTRKRKSQQDNAHVTYLGRYLPARPNISIGRDFCFSA